MKPRRSSRRWREKTLQVLGEAKATTAPVLLGALERLDHLRALLEERGVRFSPTARMLPFSRSGFTRERVERAGARPDAVLVDLALSPPPAPSVPGRCGTKGSGSAEGNVEG